VRPIPGKLPPRHLRGAYADKVRYTVLFGVAIALVILFVGLITFVGPLEGEGQSSSYSQSDGSVSEEGWLADFARWFASTLE